MISRLLAYWTVLLAGVLGGALVASPALAAGFGEARRRGGFGSALGVFCCLFVVLLIGGGIVLGIWFCRRRRG
jgi:hypothetical protein